MTKDKVIEKVDQVRYKDYSRVTKEAPELAKKTCKSARGAKTSFPDQLHKILARPDLSDIITWMPHGRAWKVLRPTVFAESVASEYFSQAKFSSFVRQANAWGFRRITQGYDVGCYYHELFLRGQPQLLRYMRRSTFDKAPIGAENEPDFYRMTWLPSLPSSPTKWPHLGSQQSAPSDAASSSSKDLAARKNDCSSHRETKHSRIEAHARRVPSPGVVRDSNMATSDRPPSSITPPSPHVDSEKESQGSNSSGVARNIMTNQPNNLMNQPIGWQGIQQPAISFGSALRGSHPQCYRKLPLRPPPPAQSFPMMADRMNPLPPADYYREEHFHQFSALHQNNLPAEFQKMQEQLLHQAFRMMHEFSNSLMRELMGFQRQVITMVQQQHLHQEQAFSATPLVFSPQLAREQPANLPNPSLPTEDDDNFNSDTSSVWTDVSEHLGGPFDDAP